jgi:hypothetical protein
MSQTVSSGSYTRKSLADAIDAYDEEIAAYQSGKRDTFQVYRQQLVAAGFDKDAVKAEIEAAKKAIRRRQIIAAGTRPSIRVKCPCPFPLLPAVATLPSRIAASRVRQRFAHRVTNGPIGRQRRWPNANGNSTIPPIAIASIPINAAGSRT